jgi:S-adenosylmethionine decarboxylase proenzyme
MNLKQFSTKGIHIMVDAYGIKPELLDNIHYLHQLGKIAIAKSGASFVDMVVKKFSPYGCTLLFLLEESHISFHTFIENLDDLERSYIAIDAFTCSSADPELAINYIVEQLKPKEVYKQHIVRGVR